MSVGWDQTFAFDRSALSSTLRAIGREPGLSTRERFDQLPFGKNKVEGYLAYLDRLGLFDRDARAPSPLGDILVREDPGWQEPGTWALLQLLMSSEPTATVWYEMTHEVLPHAAVFTKEEAEEALLRRPGVLGGKPSITRAAIWAAISGPSPKRARWVVFACCRPLSCPLRRATGGLRLQECHR